MQIPCPHCGLRDVSEFTYLGDAKVKRPDPTDAKIGDWARFIYQRDNPRGPHVELWQHNAGCRLVMEITRNTLTHEITGAVLRGPHGADAPAPKRKPARQKASPGKASAAKSASRSRKVAS